jgi:hypothetical protein
MASAGAAKAVSLLSGGLMGLAVAMRTAFGVSVGRAVLTIGVQIYKLVGAMKAAKGISLLPVFGGVGSLIERLAGSGNGRAILNIVEAFRALFSAVASGIARAFSTGPVRAFASYVIGEAHGALALLLPAIDSLIKKLLATKTAQAAMQWLPSVFIWVASVARNFLGVGVGRAILKIGVAAATTAKAVAALGAAFLALPGAGWALAGASAIAAIGYAAYRYSTSQDMNASKAKSKRPDKRMPGDQDLAAGESPQQAGAGTFSGAVAAQLGVGPGVNELRRIAEFTERTALATEKRSEPGGWLGWALGGGQQGQIEGTTLLSPAGDLSARAAPAALRSTMVADAFPVAHGPTRSMADKDLLSVAERGALASEKVAANVERLFRLIEKRPGPAYS